MAPAQIDSHGITEMNGIAPAELHPLKLHWAEALVEQNTRARA